MLHLSKELSFWLLPSQPSPNVVTWETWRGKTWSPIRSGSEIGVFTAKVGQQGLDTVRGQFANPSSIPILVQSMVTRSIVSHAI